MKTSLFSPFNIFPLAAPFILKEDPAFLLFEYSLNWVNETQENHDI